MMFEIWTKCDQSFNAYCFFLSLSLFVSLSLCSSFFVVSPNLFVLYIAFWPSCLFVHLSFCSRLSVCGWGCERVSVSGWRWKACPPAAANHHHTHTLRPILRVFDPPPRPTALCPQPGPPDRPQLLRVPVRSGQQHISTPTSRLASRA